MEMFYQFGLTQRMLEATILFGGAAVLLAVFWRLIVIGGGIILIAFIFMHHQPTPVDPVAKLESQKKEFMEDCLNIAMNDKSQCDSIWQERQREER
jgi:uncharacterized membrane protein YphA (DoxX/SURF4 family)